MANTPIPVFSTSYNADTTPIANTIVWRDSSGGVYGNVVNAATSLQTQGNYQGNVVAKSANFTAAAATDYICDATGGNITVTLPAASANTGVAYTFTKKDSSGNSITLTGALGTATTSTQYARLKALSDGTSWFSA